VSNINIGRRAFVVKIASVIHTLSEAVCDAAQVVHNAAIIQFRFRLEPKTTVACRVRTARPVARPLVWAFCLFERLEMRTDLKKERPEPGRYGPQEDRSAVG
jgi:hypothetical protein